MRKSSITQVHKTGAHARLQERYDRMWSESIGDIRTGNIEPDPVLAAGLPDDRRCLTVIARPSPSVRRRVSALLAALRDLEPDQYYYASSDLHVTVLSLFTPAVENGRFFARKEQYMTAIDAALRNVPAIRIEFSGVTTSPAAVMIQGFCENDALNEVRDVLRGQLRSRGLVEGLDGRYRLETAHITVARFRARLRDSESFASALERARRLPIGVTNITGICLVKNDWYMSRQSLETIKCYRLQL
jgi:2'-5' RNA ligase